MRTLTLLVSMFVLVGCTISSAPKGGGTSPGGPEGIKLAAEALTKNGVHAEFYVSPDSGHDFTSWKRSLYFFTPMLFRVHRAASAPWLRCFSWPASSTRSTRASSSLSAFC